MPSLTIFLDASVILSGLASPGGGSGKLFVAAGRNKLKLLATPHIIEEVVRHLNKLHIAPDQLHKLLSEKIVRLVADPSEETVNKFRHIIKDPNDAHVLAGAVISGAGILLSLDKKHILAPNVGKSLRPMSIASPKEFWRGLQKKAE